ncbi:MAG: PAS domain S-box protein [Firmicutes bacterium]|nr:PAS domain S-box protein [Bacillota bacterium]
MKGTSWKKQLERVIDTIADGIIITDQDGYILYANSASKNIFGVKQDELIGRKYDDPTLGTAMLDGKPLSGEDNPFMRAKSATKPVYNLEHAYYRPDGSQIIVSVNASPFCDGEKKVVGVILSIRDITDRKKIEYELQEKTKTLKTLIDASPLAVIALDLNWNVTIWNSAAEHIFGWRESEVLGKPQPYIPKDKIPEARMIRKRILKGESITGLEVQRFRRDGTPIYISIWAAPMYGPKNRIIGGISLVADITRQKREEEERMQLTRRMQLLLNSTDEGIYAIDTGGKVTLFNRSASKMTGYKVKEALGKQSHTLIHYSRVDGAPYPENKCPIMRALATGKGVRVDNEVFWRKDGTSFPVEYSAYPIIEMGSVHGVVVVFMDITDRKLEERLDIALNEVNAAINSTLSFSEIMRRVVEQATRAIGSETALIVLHENGSWVLRYLYGLPEDHLGIRFTDKDIPYIRLAVKSTKPLAVNDVYRDSRISQEVLRRFILRSILIVPLIMRGNVIGMLSFNYHSHLHKFTDHEVDFAVKLGASISLALENARLYETEKDVSNTLQSAVLTVPEKVEGVKYGHLYRSATESTKVGGDFYDIFEVEHGKVGIIIGDVSGKGIKAATLTSLVKNTIKAYAYEDTSSASIIRKTNEVVTRATTSAMFVTVFFGLLDIKTGELSYCSAGHPPGLLKRKAGAIDRLDTFSPAIGAFPGLNFIEDRVTLKKGDVLVLYTDGVTEARCNRGFFGEEKLIEVVGALRQKNIKEIPEIIFSKIMECTGGKLTDDIALIAVSLS